jgi:hypothetical protein
MKRRANVCVSRTTTYSFIFFGVLLIPLFASGEDISAMLKSNLVTEKGDRFVHDQTVRCRFPAAYGGSSVVYIERHIEAPKSLISRDNVVSVATSFLFRNRAVLSSMLDPTLTLVEAVSAISCRSVEPRAKGADYKISITMHEGGMRIDTKDPKSGTAAVDELSWRQVFGLTSED